MTPPYRGPIMWYFVGAKIGLYYCVIKRCVSTAPHQRNADWCLNKSLLAIWHVICWFVWPPPRLLGPTVHCSPAYRVDPPIMQALLAMFFVALIQKIRIGLLLINVADNTTVPHRLAVIAVALSQGCTVGHKIKQHGGGAGCLPIYWSN